MDITYRLGGNVLTNRVRFLDEGSGFVTAAERGALGTGGVLIDDPSGNLTITGWESFTIDDANASPTRLFTGFIASRGIKRYRESDRTSVSRTHDCVVFDQNALLKLIVNRHNDNDASRPAETDVATITWLLGSRALTGIVFDNGLVSSANPGSFLKADYRRKYALDVISELTPSTIKNGFVYRDHGSGEPSLFYDKDTSTAYSTPIRISNDLSDLNIAAGTYAPLRDAELELTPENKYSDVSYGFVGGVVHVVSAAITALYVALGLPGRSAVYDTSRVGKTSTALVTGAEWLNVRSGEADKIIVTFLISSAHVGLVEAGMRMSVKFTHLPGFTSFTWARIRRRTIIPENEDQWRVRLELWLPPAPVDDAEGDDDGVCYATFGELQSQAGAANGHASPYAAGAGDYEIVYSRTGDSPDSGWPSNPKTGLISYLPVYADGGAPLGSYFRGLTVGGFGSPTPEVIFDTTYIASGDDTRRLSIYLNGVEALFDTETGSGGLRFIAYTKTLSGAVAVVAGDVLSARYSTTGAVGGSITIGGGLAEGVHFRVSGIVCDDAEEPLPFQGDWIGPTVASGPVNGSNVLFNSSNSTLPGTFVPGTLQVLHDGTDQTAHATVEPTTGEIVMDYAPSYGSTMRVRYQAD